ncbi:MAG TPA: hypothetical protein VNE39_16975 [Planctomycetota bacterium]|nr:hypothetical protein [Planctomycetota bacterium]
MAENPRRSPPRWRRRWKRAPAASRAAAAASLGDLFRRRRAATLLPLALAVSAVLHGMMAPLLLRGRGTSVDDLAAQEGTYLSQVLQKERARAVSREVQGRLTMPPPPPEPEAVVQSALTESLTSDVAKITGDLLNVELQRDLANYVQASLKDELAAAAADIATGKLSEEEIRELHRKFQEKAHEKTLAWRKDYLIQHQEERAAMSTTEWYERDVSQTLFGNMQFELFRAFHKLWFNEFGRAEETLHWGRWGFLGLSGFERKVGQLRKLLPAKDKEVPPGAEHAQLVGQGLAAIRGKQLFDGRFTQTYSWDTAWKHHIEEYFPHRAEAMRTAHDEALAALWDKALAAADAYQNKPEGDAQAAALAAIRELCEAAERTLPKNDRDYEAANQAIRSRVLRGPARERMFERWAGGLVEGLSPLIRDMARGQFKKGIIVHKDGLDRAMQEFTQSVVPLVRLDTLRMFPQPVFNRTIFVMDYANPYRSKVTGKDGPPDAEDIATDEKALADVLSRWPEADRAYVEARAKVIEEQFQRAIDRAKEGILTRVLTGDLLFKQMGNFVEGVDYADKVQEKLDARAMALKGRGQDLAKLTKDGVPDTSAPLVALLFGASKGHGANLQPVPATMQPAMVTPGEGPELALRSALPSLPPAAARWGFEEQATVQPQFKDSPRFEAIPFLTKFPRLDGDLSDWGKIRPLLLRPGRGEEAILVYAAWNYQGFFFGYQVKQDAERFYYPSLWQMGHNHNTGGVEYHKVTGVEWAYRGDYLRLMFDTLDARNDTRGEPHTQEFVIFPLGIESDPNVPGIERVIASQRDATTKEYRGVKSTCHIFPPQPPPESGPDGSGPYRVTKQTATGYTVEVFIPRSLFRVPVFAPGWHIGFDCVAATGVQPGDNSRLNRFGGQAWASGSEADRPERWGDLLLLGTDPRILLQEANAAGSLVQSLLPGQSYLLTVIDPDRNVNPAADDTVLVSTEADRAGGDVEVFVLRETEKNSAVFRGFVDTQPGLGRQVQGVLEVMPLQQVRFGYVDFANAKGKRNVINEMRLPVVAPVARLARAAEQARQDAE